MRFESKIKIVLLYAVLMTLLGCYESERFAVFQDGIFRAQHTKFWYNYIRLPL